MNKNPSFGKKRRSQPARAQRDWSEYQQDIFQNVANGEGNTVVQASPGSGKSTTIIEAGYHVPKEYHSSVLMAAFNKTTVGHLKSRVPSSFRTSNFHQLGFGIVKSHWGEAYDLQGRQAVDDEGIIAEKLAVQEIPTARNKLIQSMVRSMSLSKVSLAWDEEDIDKVNAEHGIDTDGIPPLDFAKHIQNMMVKTAVEPQKLDGHHAISFDDMLWLPAVNNWPAQKQYARVFVDEAQDLSHARYQLVVKSLEANGRLLACADPHQAIYSFAGASAEIFDRLANQMEATRLPLSVSYRLPKQIARLAQQINPDLEPNPKAIEGAINTLDASSLPNKLSPGDAVLSRTNYPLIELVFCLLAQGTNATIQGRDIGQRFLWRIQCWEPKDVDELVLRIHNWRNDIVKRLNEYKRPTHRIEDEAESILRFARGAGTIREVQDRIRRAFSNTTSSHVKLSTTHKAKGLEWDRVYLLDHTFRPEQGGEEECIHYVAITRAKKELNIALGKLR